MKKLLLFTFIVCGSFAVISCGKDECQCTASGNTNTFTEDDINNGSTLEEACNDANAALTSPDECHIK